MTTVVRPILQTPNIDSSRFSVGRTATASDAFVLVDLVNDAASGHPPQRASINRSLAGDYAFFYDPRSVARILSLSVTVAWNGTWVPNDGVNIDVSITDGTATILSSDASIPWGLKADALLVPTAAAGRMNSAGQTTWHLDKDALVTAGLSATVPWVFLVSITCTGATVYMENLTFEEVSRFTVDSLDDPQIYLPRSAITSSINRIPTVLNNAYDRNRRTYHNLSLATSGALAVTAAAWAYIPNPAGTRLVQSYGTTPMPWTVCPRRILGAPALEWGCYYKTSLGGAGNDGYLELTTSTGAVSVTLPASTTWTFVTVASGTLADAATDTISWRAYVDGGGTLSLASFWVCDDPVPGP